MAATMIKLRHSSSGTDSMMQFFTKKIDLAYVGITPYLMARSYGVPVRVIGIASQFAESHAVIVSPGWERRSMLRVATVWGSTAHLIAEEWSRTVEQPCSFLNLGLNEQLQALESGFVDVIACWDPFATIAEDRGFARIYDGRRMARPSFNLICASDELIDGYPRAARAFVAAHHAGVAKMLSTDSAELTEYLATIFDNRLPGSLFTHVLRDRYLWPVVRYTDVPGPQDPVWHALEHSAAFLRRIGQSGITELDLSSCFARIGDDGELPAQISLGYSDSFMCAPFHIAALSRDLASHGFRVDPTTRRLTERLASCDARVRRDLVRARELMESDIAAAVIQIGDVHESVLEEQLLASLASPRPVQSGGALGELERRQVLPAQLSAGAYFVRALRIAAQRGSAVTKTEAERAMAQLLDLLDFRSSETLVSIDRCRRCGRHLELAWPSCPTCGVPVAESPGSAADQVDD